MIRRWLVRRRERAAQRWLDANADYRDARKHHDVDDMVHTAVLIRVRRDAMRRADAWLDLWTREGTR